MSRLLRTLGDLAGPHTLANWSDLCTRQWFK